MSSAVEHLLELRRVAGHSELVPRDHLDARELEARRQPRGRCAADPGRARRPPRASRTRPGRRRIAASRPARRSTSASRRSRSTRAARARCGSNATPAKFTTRNRSRNACAALRTAGSVNANASAASDAAVASQRDARAGTRRSAAPGASSVCRRDLSRRANSAGGSAASSFRNSSFISSPRVTSRDAAPATARCTIVPTFDSLSPVSSAIARFVAPGAVLERNELALALGQPREQRAKALGDPSARARAPRACRRARRPPPPRAARARAARASDRSRRCARSRAARSRSRRGRAGSGARARHAFSNVVDGQVLGARAVPHPVAEEVVDPRQLLGVDRVPVGLGGRGLRQEAGRHVGFERHRSNIRSGSRSITRLRAMRRRSIAQNLHAFDAGTLAKIDSPKRGNRWGLGSLANSALFGRPLTSRKRPFAVYPVKGPQSTRSRRSRDDSLAAAYLTIA